MPDNPVPPTGEIILYLTEDGQARLECRFAEEILWLTQMLIADLLQVTVPTVNEHLKNIFEGGELQPGPTIRKFRIVRQEGAREVAPGSPALSRSGRAKLLESPAASRPLAAAGCC